LGQFAASVAGYWLSTEKPQRRISDDIRFELHDLSSFKKRFNQRFGDQIKALDQQEDGKKLKARISMAMVVPTTIKAFTANQWFFDVSNALALDDVAPVELKSGLRSGMDWVQYMEDYNAGVQGFILKEKVVRPSGGPSYLTQYLNKKEFLPPAMSADKPEVARL
jgi:fatty acyl-CoA reductase